MGRAARLFPAVLPAAQERLGNEGLMSDSWHIQHGDVGWAADAAELVAVDEVAITVLADNAYDALLPSTPVADRATLAELRRTPSTMYLEGETNTGLRAEHGFAALVSVRVGETWRSLLLDTGNSADGVVSNADALGVDLAVAEGVVLSHGHFDHTGGLAAVANRLAAAVGDIPLYLHPAAWSRRRIAAPDRVPEYLPTLDRQAVLDCGYVPVEREHASLLLDAKVLLTGQVDRTTEYERGIPFHEALRDGRWVPDPLIDDDQVLVVNVRDRGLVLLSGCSHSGVINILRYALRLTGVETVYAVIGGLHLAGPAGEAALEPTVSAMAGLAPHLIVPGHCTGWKAQHRIAATFADAFVPSVVGTRYTIAAP